MNSDLYVLEWVTQTLVGLVLSIHNTNKSLYYVLLMLLLSIYVLSICFNVKVA